MRKAYTILTLVLLSFFAKAQFPDPDTCYFRLYGGEQIEEFRDIVNVKSDSGHAALGSTSSFSHGSGDFYMVRTDWKGNTLWSRHIGTPGIDKGYAIKETPGGGFIIGGYTNWTPNNDYDMYVVKTDSEGFVQWTNHYGGADWDFLYSIAVLPDSGYVLCGETYSFGNVASDVYLIRTDKNGAIIWEKNYGGLNKDGGLDVLVSELDTSIAVAGYTESYGAGARDAYFLKCKYTTGDTVFTRTYGGIYNEEFNSITESTFPTFRGFVMAGYAESFDMGTEHDKDSYCVKIDSAGNFKWQELHGHPTGEDISTSICNLGPLDFFVAGKTPFGGGMMDIGCGVLNFGGYYLYAFANSYGGSFPDYAWANTMSLRNDYIMAGYTESFNAKNGDAFITIADSVKSPQIIAFEVSSDTIISVQQLEAQQYVSVFPNPASGIVYLATSEKIQSVCLFDLEGKAVEINLPATGFLPGIQKLDLSALASGVYFLRLVQNNKTFVTKIVLTGN